MQQATTLPTHTTGASKSTTDLWIGYGVIIILAIVGLFLSTRSSFYTHCQRSEAGAPVECTVEQRWFGLVANSVERVEAVQSIGANGYRSLPTRRDERSQLRTYNHLTIVGRTNEIDISHEEGSIIGSSNATLALQLDAFLADQQALHVSAWQVEWLPALVGGAFLLIPAFVMISLLGRFVSFLRSVIA